MPATGSGVPPEVVAVYRSHRAMGLSITAAAREAQISRSVAHALEDSRLQPNVASATDRVSKSRSSMRTGKAGNGNPWADSYAGALGEDGLEPPVPPDELCAEAAASLEDFALFRRRYFGRGPSPWQVDAGEKVVGLLLEAQRTQQREYLVLNAPPSAGKSTLWHDVCCWLICRDRRVRILYGSRTSGQAMKYTQRIRSSLSQRSLYVPKEADLRTGMSVAPAGVLARDFGRFKPLDRFTVWQKGGFIVAQADEEGTGEKEPTVTAFGFDSDYLGMRVDLAIWDDLVDYDNLRTLDVIENLQEDWDNVAEQRIDPGGLCVLQGQRLKHNDLYRYCLDKRRARDEESDEDSLTDDDMVPKYHHVVYPAHAEARCHELHKRTDPAYDPADPDGRGCLLDPRRLPWRDLRTDMDTQPDKFRVVMQQEDLDPELALVRPIWVSGGRDEETGAVHPGCWDHDRGLWEWPTLSGAAHQAMVVDPSPSNYWACQLWLHHPDSERQFLLAIDRRRMEAPELLDWSADRHCFTGLLEDWWVRADEAGRPFRYVVVEVNAAQKFLLQYDHAKRWATQRGVSFVPHTTGVRKTDDNSGIPALKTLWRTGRVRLPGRPDGSKAAAELLVRESLRWPHGTTDDQVLAHWFFNFTLPKLSPRRPAAKAAQKRPSWLGTSVGGVPAAWHKVFAGQKGA
jgi:hypothetical protein